MSSEATSGPDYGILTHRFLSSKQWDRALSAAHEWLGKEPENLHAHRVAAQSLINLNREPEAQSHLERVLAGNPEDDFAHRLMSITQFEQGRFKAADDSIRKAISLDPNDAFHWHHLARMSYNQGDRTTARKCAEKARALNPRNADILNLLILCEPDGAANVQVKILRYQQALELDPENANLHNNMGAQYLDGLKDYAQAEACFRRALFIDPSSKMFRGNLFIAMKHRDLVYRILCAPKDFLLMIFGVFGDLRQKSWLLYFLLIPIWLVMFRFALGGLILWFALVWPLTKVYEYLTIGDLKAKAGEVGARRGGVLGYRKWSLQFRLSLFGIFLVSFWGMVAWLFLANSDSKPGNPNRFYELIGILIFFAALAFLIYWIRRVIRSHRATHAARHRAMQVAAILEPRQKQRPWWQFFRTKSE
jgi:tetratricopeptide (TPR) repeat protein